MLQVELQELKEADFDLDLVGFSEEELEGVMAGPEETKAGLTDEDAVPEEPENVITKPGDLWVLGDHRLLCGDSTKTAERRTVVVRIVGEFTCALAAFPERGELWLRVPYGSQFTGIGDCREYVLVGGGTGIADGSLGCR